MYSDGRRGGGGYYDSRSASSCGRDRYELERKKPSSEGRRHSASGRNTLPRRYRSPSPRGDSSRHRKSPSPGSFRHRRSPSPGSSRHRRSPSPGPSHRRYESRETHRDDFSHHDRHREKERRSPERSRRDSGERLCRGDDHKNVLERMEKSFSDGPLEVLRNCMNKKIRVKIWTRNHTNMRGVCSGFVLAFDKHWNIILRDADEIFLRPRRTKNPFIREIKPEDSVLIPEAKPKVPKVKTHAVVESEEQEFRDGSIREDIESIEQKTEQMYIKPVERTFSSPEEYAEFMLKKEAKKRKRKRRKAPTVDRRYVGQMFIRGDNISIISVCPNAEEEEEGSDERSDILSKLCGRDADGSEA